MILQVLNNLDLNDLANCVMVSKRIRGICKNLSKFQKINLYNKVVPSGFVQLVLNSGCKYLSLYWAQILQGDNELKLEKPCKLRYLDLSDCKCRTEDIEEILSSCYFLEKLTRCNSVDSKHDKKHMSTKQPNTGNLKPDLL